MAHPTFEQAAQWIAAVLGGGAGVKLLDIWSKRAAAQRREPAGMTRASADLMESLSEGGKELLDEFRKEFRYLRGRVADQERELIEVKRIAEAAQGDHSHCQAQLQELRAEIARLMAGPIAAVADKAPKDRL